MNSCLFICMSLILWIVMVHSFQLSQCHVKLLQLKKVMPTTLEMLTLSKIRHHHTLKMSDDDSTVTDMMLNEAIQDEIVSIPTYLPSACGVDYVPLATMLATGDFLSADQFTRDNLIRISGAQAKGRSFVYWTEVHDIPSIDLATMERLWLQFSNGNFGYSIQKRVWDLENGNFDAFIRRIGWTKVDNGIERKLRWFGQNEYIYDLNKAPKAHLPLTSALRGTQLIRQLLTHPVWDQYDWKNYQSINWEESK